MLGKSFELIFEILHLLPSKPRYWVRSAITSARWSMAFGAILNLGLECPFVKAVSAHVSRLAYGGENNGKDICC